MFSFLKKKPYFFLKVPLIRDTQPPAIQPRDTLFFRTSLWTGTWSSTRTRARTLTHCSAGLESTHAHAHPSLLGSLPSVRDCSRLDYQARIPCKEPWHEVTAAPWCGCGCGEPASPPTFPRFMFMKVLEEPDGGSAGMLLYVQL